MRKRIQGETERAVNARTATATNVETRATNVARRVNVMFRAFSDPTRLRILHLIRDREMCVGDIVKALRLPQPTVSRHLAYLRRARLVNGRKAGLWVYYSIATPESSFQERLIGCLAGCFDDVPDIARDAQRAGKVRRSGGCCPK
jgi:ArsR family transcriptional regulator